MAVKFEFTMSDEDAWNLMASIRETALRNEEYIIDYKTRKDLTQEQKKVYVEWLTANKEYTLGLIDQMKNTSVEE